MNSSDDTHNAFLRWRWASAWRSVRRNEAPCTMLDSLARRAMCDRLMGDPLAKRLAVMSNAAMVSWLRGSAARSDVVAPRDPFLRRWLTGQPADPEDPG